MTRVGKVRARWFISWPSCGTATHAAGSGHRSGAPVPRADPPPPWSPRQQRTVIGLAAVGNLAHAASHLRGHARHRPPALSALAGALPQGSTLLSGTLLGAALWVRPRPPGPVRARFPQRLPRVRGKEVPDD